MKHLPIVVACLLLIAGCSKKAENATSNAGQPGTDSGGQPAAAAKPAAGPSESAEPKKVDITEDLVVKYMGYQKENLALLAKYSEETKKNMEAAKGDTAKLGQQLAIAERLGKELEAQQQAKRRELGLSEEEFKALQDAAQTVATSRALYNQMGGDAQLAQMEADQEADCRAPGRSARGGHRADERDVEEPQKPQGRRRCPREVRRQGGRRPDEARRRACQAVLGRAQEDGGQEIGGRVMPPIRLSCRSTRSVRRRIAVCLVLAACLTLPTAAARDARMDWWREARFGMFIHWGLYAVPAGEWKGADRHGEWIRNNAQIPVDEYDKFRAQFNPMKFDADAWVAHGQGTPA